MISRNSLYHSSWSYTEGFFLKTFCKLRFLLWMKLVRKNSRILSQHSHFRSLKDKTRGLRAIRVTWSRFTRQWILPLLFHHYFFVPKRRGGCDSLSCHSIIATGVDWPSVGVTFDVCQITLKKHTFIYMLSVGGWSIACRVGGSCLVSSKRPKTL